jgi:hypothetical protein
MIGYIRCSQAAINLSRKDIRGFRLTLWVTRSLLEMPASIALIGGHCIGNEPALRKLQMRLG